MVVKYGRYHRWPTDWPGRLPGFVRWPFFMTDQWAWPYAFRIIRLANNIDLFWETPKVASARYLSTFQGVTTWTIEPSLIQNGTETFFEARLAQLDTTRPIIIYRILFIGSNAGFWNGVPNAEDMRAGGFSARPGQARNTVMEIQNTIGFPGQEFGLWGFSIRGACVVGEE